MPLHRAAEHGSVELAKLLLERGADASKADEARSSCWQRQDGACTALCGPFAGALVRLLPGLRSRPAGKGRGCLGL